MLGAVGGRLPVATPRVLSLGSQDGWLYLLMSRMPGVPLEGVWDTLSAVDRDRLAADLGETLAV